MCFSTVCILLALALIGANSSEFPGGKLNLAALSFYFCENTSFFLSDLFFYNRHSVLQNTFRMLFIFRNSISRGKITGRIYQGNQQRLLLSAY